MADAYVTLGVSSSASMAEVKTAFKRLAMQHHPDTIHAHASEAELKAAALRFQALVDAHESIITRDSRQHSSRGASTRAGSEYARYESAAAGMGAHGFKYTHATDLGSATGCASPNALRNLGVLWGFILFSTGLLYLGSSGSGPRPRRAQGPHMRHVSSQPVERRRPLSDPQDNGLLRGSAQMERATLRPRIARQAEAAAAAAETTDAGVEDDKELNELWREHQTSKLKGRGIHRRTKPFHPSRRGETFGTQSHGMLAAVYTDSGGVWSHVQAAEAAAEAGAGALPDPATEKRGGAPQEAAAVPPPLQPTCRRADL